MPNYKERIRQRVQDQQAVLEQDQNIKKAHRLDSKEKRAFDRLPDQTTFEFWCPRCLVDFPAPAYKSWNDRYEVGSWMSQCPLCEDIVVRYINDKLSDPYYDQSEKIAIMRNTGAADMLRPDQYGFRTLYGNPYAEYHHSRVALAEHIRERYATTGLHGLTLKEKSETEKAKEFFDAD